jgi:allophanate hydrolase subunit 2
MAMNNAAYAHYDTVVIDDPDSQAPVAVTRSRTTTEELQMQVLVHGEWHRMLDDHTQTACGEPWHAGRTPSERTGPRLTARGGRLCGRCYTPREIEKAAENDLKAKGY